MDWGVIVLGAILVVAVVVPSLLSYYTRKTLRYLKVLSKELSGMLVSDKTGKYLINARHKGEAFRFVFTPNIKLSAVFAVEIERSFPAEMALHREGRLARLFKKLGMSSEYQTDDPDFDAAFYVVTRTPEFVRTFVAQPDNRRAVTAIFSALPGVSSLTLSKDLLKVQMGVLALDFRTEVDKPCITHVVEIMQWLAEGVRSRRRDGHTGLEADLKVVDWTSTSIT